MKIQRLEINNFRGINTMKISCNDHLNIFCGVNGSGKSSILDSIVLQLSWIIARIRQSKGGGGRPIGEFDVKNDKGFSMINMQILDNDTVYTGVLVKGKKGIMIKERSDMSEFSKYAKKIKQDITDNNGTTSIPLFVYYSTNRAVTEKSLRFRTKHDFNLLETYEDSLRTGVNFTSFFKWYRSREDLENELYREQLSNQESNSQYDGDKQLRVVRSALKALSGFEGVSVKRRPQRMEVIKNGVKLRVEQLSDGEKIVFALAGDLSRRLAIANPMAADPLAGEGVVLIDEIELHLHPQWQKTIIPRLLETFPNIQFFITTHSPQVLSAVNGKNIVVLYQNENMDIMYDTVKQSKGLNSSEILEEIFDTLPIDEKAKHTLDGIFQAIDDERFDEAKEDIAKFKQTYGSVPELIRAEALLTLYGVESVDG